jgi:hypothetical protein
MTKYGSSSIWIFRPFLKSLLLYMGGIPFSILVSYIVAHGEFFGNIGKAYPCVKGKQALEFPELPVNTVSMSDICGSGGASPRVSRLRRDFSRT